jgi:hypothetical protein
MERKNIPRATKVKLLLCGRVATASYYEKEIYYNTQYSKLKKNKQQEKRDKTKEEAEDIAKRSAYRTRNNVYNLISTNAWFWKRNNNTPFWPSFLTLTFKENITDVKEGNYLQSKFIKRLNYYIYKTKKTQIKYLSVIEFQKRGAIHYHIIFFNMPMIPKKELAEIWEHGFIIIKGLDKEQNVAGYLTKYMTKGNIDSRLRGKKRYFRSRGLLKPVEINIEEQALELISKIPETYIKKRSSYESDYHGQIDVVEYDFGQAKSINDVLKLNH